MSSSQDLRDKSAGKDYPLHHDTNDQDSSAGNTRPSTLGAAGERSKIPSPDVLSSTSPDEYEEQAGLYDFAEELRNKEPPVEPWFLEGSRLRRMYILWLNKQLALCRKGILERQQPSDQDMEDLGKILHLQGKIRPDTPDPKVMLSTCIAEAARDLRVIRSLDFLTSGEQEHLHQRTVQYFPRTAASIFPDVEPFETENYRRVGAPDQTVVFDGVREVLRRFLPKRISWPKDERISRKEFYDQGTYAPERLSNAADRLARFIVAMGGALFILVPMYIMALRQDPVKNLVTTTVAVVLFALVCSIPLKLANDQTFSATVGYAAVLMVLVGLTSSPPPASSS